MKEIKDTDLPTAEEKEAALREARAGLQDARFKELMSEADIALDAHHKVLDALKTLVAYVFNSEYDPKKGPIDGKKEKRSQKNDS